MVNPGDLNIGDLLSCDTMTGFVGKITNISPATTITLKAIYNYTNHMGIFRSKGNTFNKEFDSDWLTYNKEEPTYKIYYKKGD